MARVRSIALSLAASCAMLAMGACGQPARPDRNPAATRDDVKILARAQEILASEAVWDRADDRVCHASDTTWSLYCALEKASIEVLGRPEHRRAALEEVRAVIDEEPGAKDFRHRLMDFNNRPTTTFADVKRVLRVARERLEEREAR